MAGAYSGHLLQSYYTSQAMNSNLVTSGSISFNPTMHGTPMPSMSFFGSQMPFLATPYANENISEETAKRIAALQVKLDQKLGPEYISQRQGPRGGPKLTYAEGWKIINLANEVFGFNGWSSNLVNLTTDFVDRSESGRYNVGVTAVVRVTLREGVYHEDLGYGTAENCPNKGQALDKCKKEAVTDGLKRALRNFGNLMGNCLYDKAYTQEVVKIKVPAAKFDKSELHRRPEFAEDTKPQINLNASKPPVPPFNPNASTSSSMSTSASASRQPASGSSRNSMPNGRPVMNSRPSANPTNNGASSSTVNTSVQSAHNVSNQNTRPPQSHQQHQPQQHQQQLAQNRRVSFAEGSAQASRNSAPVADESGQNIIAKEEPENSFDFSDDDVFLAALEGLGRPIETDADMGQPIDQGESYLPPEGDTHTPVNDTSTADISMNGMPQNDKATKLQRWQQEITNASSSNTNPFNTTSPRQQPTPTEQIQNTSSSSSTRALLNDSRSTGYQTNQHAHAQQRSHRPFARPALNQHQNQNENQNISLSGSSESGSKRPPTPSMGGFHFPPGMNPPQSHNNVQQGQHGGNGVGLKRSADAMSGIGGTGGGGGFRSSRPGMGLQQAIPQQRREPFAPLEIGEGGNTKRIKR